MCPVRSVTYVSGRSKMRSVLRTLDIGQVLRVFGAVGVDDHRHTRERRHDRVQQLDAFLVLTQGEGCDDAGDISARTGEVAGQLGQTCLPCRADDNGNRWRCGRCRAGARTGVCKVDIRLQADQLGREAWQSIVRKLGKPFDNVHIVLAHPAQRRKSSGERSIDGAGVAATYSRHRRQNGQAWAPALSCSQCGHQARDHGNKKCPRPQDHSMTSSARATIVGDIARPKARAAFRFNANSNAVGCSIASSAGEAPRKMRATKCANRWRNAAMLGPYPSRQPALAMVAHSQLVGRRASWACLASTAVSAKNLGSEPITNAWARAARMATKAAS